MAKKTNSPTSSTVKMGMMCGWLSLAAVRASRRKRSRSFPSLVRAGGSSLRAPSRSSRTSRARYTIPMPPRPSSRSSEYRPARADWKSRKRRSGWSGIGGWYCEAVEGGRTRQRGRPRSPSTAFYRPPSDSAAYARPRTLHPGDALPRRAHATRPDAGRGARARLQRVERLLGTQDRAHRELLHPDRGAFDHDFSRARPDLDSREQYREDNGLGERLRGRGRGLHHSGHPLDGLRLGDRSRGDARDGRRADGRADDDSAATRVDRQGARHARLPGGHRLRRGPDRRGGARPPGQARLPGVRRRLRLQVPHGRAQALARRARESPGLLSGRRRVHRDIPRADGGGVHHRPAHRRLSLRRRLLRVPGARPRDQARRIGSHGAVRVSGGQADPRHESGRAALQLRLLHWGRRRCLSRDHRPRPLAPDHHELLRLEPQRSAWVRAEPGHDAPAHRRRPPYLPHRRGFDRAGHRPHPAAAARREPARRGADRDLRVLLRHRVLPRHGADRVFGEPDFRHDHRRAARHVPHLRRDRLDRRGPPRAGDLHRRGRRGGDGERRKHVAGFEDPVPRGIDAAPQGVGPGKYLMDPKPHALPYVLAPGTGGRTHDSRGRTTPRLDSPKATIMALITDGILTHKLPWALVLLGVFITIAIELMGVQALPVAVGVYLPISTSSALFAGGVVRWLVERRVHARQQSLAEVESGAGVLFSSGLIAGGAIGGIVLAAIAGVLGSADGLAEKLPLFHALGSLPASNALAFGLFAALGALLYRVCLRPQ